MRNFFIFLTFLLFIFRKDKVILGASTALNLWSKNIFPILFPTFIIADLIISSSLIIIITKLFGRVFKKIFKTTEYSAIIFFISLLCGTPTNAKLLKNLYNNGLIREDAITKILSFSYFSNPFFILTFTSFKVLLIFWISNILTGLILRNKYTNDFTDLDIKNNSFNLNNSISNNLTIILNILGTITVFMVISYSIPFFNPFINVILTSFLELSTALYKIKMYLNLDIFYLVALSLSGLSILLQIKSIMKDTFVDYKFIIKSRIITALLCIFIECFLAI